MDALFLILIISSYLMGSVSSAIIICHLFKLGDPRDAGSGNPGATNVLRLGGKRAALLTLLGDVLKGVIPVSVSIYLDYPSWVTGLAAVAAFLGHLYPIFFKFKGGKGVATFFGVLIVYNWFLAIYAILLWLVCAWTFRISSLSALITTITVPFYSWFFFKEQFPFITFMCVLLVLRHHSNIRKIFSGDESRIGKEKSESSKKADTPSID